jgi:hypothetical protein
MVSIFSSRSSETSSYRARLEKMREGRLCERWQEAGMFRLAAGKYYPPPHAHDWINQAIEEGRRELEAQHALEREIETWDMACRTMFLLMTNPGLVSSGHGNVLRVSMANKGGQMNFANSTRMR